jgi:hypothetical protein
MKLEILSDLLLRLVEHVLALRLSAFRVHRLVQVVPHKIDHPVFVLAVTYQLASLGRIRFFEVAI